MIRAALLAAIVHAAPAAAVECRLALILAMDVSSSVDAEEDALQRGGLAAALVAPEVKRAFFASPLPVALAVFEWSGRYNQELIVDWRLVTTPVVLAEISDRIAQSRRSHNEFPTAIGHALGYGAVLFRRAPPCLFKTLDMAGDGENNEGFGPRQAYAEFDFNRVTVNGLVVNAGDFEAETSLIDFYEKEILHGPTAFLEVAQGFGDYENAMRRKLEREVRPTIVGGGERDARPPG